MIEGRKKFIFASIYLTVNIALLISSFSKARLLEERICSKLFIFVTQVIGWKARHAFTIQMQNVFERRMVNLSQTSVAPGADIIFHLE